MSRKSNKDLYPPNKLIETNSIKPVIGTTGDEDKANPLFFGGLEMLIDKDLSHN